MTVVAVDSARGLALCADEDGVALDGRDGAGRAGRRRRPAARARGNGDRAPRRRQRAAGVRYVDEFRDAELGRAVAGEILSLVEPGRHYKLMEVCGGHTHSIYKYGVDDLLPANVELVHGPGLSGLRDPDGPRRRRHRDRPQRRA